MPKSAYGNAFGRALVALGAEVEGTLASWCCLEDFWGFLGEAWKCWACFRQILGVSCGVEIFQKNPRIDLRVGLGCVWGMSRWC